MGSSVSSMATTPSHLQRVSLFDWRSSSLLWFSLSSSHLYRVRNLFRLLWSTGSTWRRAMLRTDGFPPVMRPVRYCLNLLNWCQENILRKKSADSSTTPGCPITGSIASTITQRGGSFINRKT